MKVILDNKSKGKVGEVLRQNITKNAHLSILSRFFSIYGYSILKKELDKIGSLRLLIPSDSSSTDSNTEHIFRAKNLIGTQNERSFRNTLNLNGGCT